MTYLIIYFFVNAFILGSLFGSFFSLATYRIPRKQDIYVTNSYCPVCKHNLGFFDLFPILSYLMHGCRCKYCNCKINIRYLLLEVGNAAAFTLAFGILYCIIGFNLNLLIAFIAFVIIYAIIFLMVGVKIERKKYEAELKKA
ncbi:MAG: prepilin peptidase [Clostridia bacterium]